MKKIILILACSLSANTFASIEVLDRIAVIVDDGLIMESQIKSGFKEIVSLYKEQNIPLPGSDNLKDQVIESLIIEELQLQMANRAGVRISDSELNDAITRIANNSQMELEEFIAYIENDGESYESFRENVRKQMLIQRVQRGRVGSEINITEKEFAAFMETDESLVELEPELFVRQILVRGSDEADAVILRIENGEEFFEIAKEVSISSNSINGGELPWRKIVDMPELFSNALKNEDIGFISEPLKSGAGFHILKVEDKRGPFVQYEDQWFSRHISLSPSAIRDEESTELEINAIRDRVLNGEEFADLAEEYSEDPGSAKQGGNLDWLGKDVLAPEFEKVMIDSSIGIVSEELQTQFGFHFLEVLEKRNYDMTRDLIEDKAYQLLYGRKYEEELENTLRSMRADAFVEIKDLD